MHSWDNYRFLLALAQGKTMAAAARSLGTDVATVSRRVEKLNELYGRPVFLKRADGWDLAPGFSSLVNLLSDFSEKLTSARNNLALGVTEQRTQMTIGCPPMIASNVLLPTLGQSSRMPSNVDFTFTHRTFEDGLGDCDIVVRFGRPGAGRIVTRRAGTIGFRLFAREGSSTADRWAGLTPQHDSYGPMQLGFARFGGPPSIRVDQVEHLAEVMLATGLPGPLPEVVARRAGQLIPIGEDERFDAEFWLLFHESRVHDGALRQSVDWIVHAFRHAGAVEPVGSFANPELRNC